MMRPRHRRPERFYRRATCPLFGRGDGGKLVGVEEDARQIGGTHGNMRRQGIFTVLQVVVAHCWRLARWRRLSGWGAGGSGKPEAGENKGAEEDENGGERGPHDE